MALLSTDGDGHFYHNLPLFSPLATNGNSVQV